MSYQVIARKYRPQRFSDVVGQEHVTKTLENAISQSRIAHAYLFCGPRGTGKTTIARIFAKCLRCVKAPTIEPCNECPECRAIDSGSSMDMMEFDAASNTQVDKIREIIIDHVRYAPSSGKLKMYLVDEVHMLSGSSFNALLKTLEEPPEHVKFLFATTDPEKLPITVLSRCQRFDLRRIPIALITKHLTAIAAKEKIQIDPAALFAIARGADGGMRDAESSLDQLISFCGNKITEQDVLGMFGLTAQAQLISLADAILKGEAETVLRELDDLTKHGKDLGRLLSDVLSHFRNLLIFQITRGDNKMLEVSEAESASLKEQSKAVSTESLTRIMEVLTDADGGLRDAASKRIFVEVAMLKAIQARQAVSIDAVLKQLNALRGGDSSSSGAKTATTAAPVPQTPASAPATKPTRIAAEAEAVPASPQVVAEVATPAPGVPSLQTLWSQLIEAVGRVSVFTRSYLLQAHPVSLQKNTFTIGFSPEFADQLSVFDTPHNRTLLQTKLQELGQAGCMVKFVQAENPVGHLAPAPETPAPVPMARSASGSFPQAEPRKPGPVALNQADFKNDPLIKKALEIFKGQIVEIRT